MPEPRVIDVPADLHGVCRRCKKDCCNCVGCVARKGGERDVCTRCFEAAKKEAMP
jgi:hypothetical protein